MTAARTTVAGALALLVVGCSSPTLPAEPQPSTPRAGNPSEQATPDIEPSVALSPTPSPTPSATVSSGAELPQPYFVDGPLDEGTNAVKVVEKLSEVADGRPALKLDVTPTQATVTVLEEDDAVSTFRWSENTIDITASDFQYLGQATFDPADYPLEHIGRMFDIADLRGVRGQLLYQVQEYRAGDVVQTVSSLPESATVFFELDGSAIPDLDGAHAGDILEGHEELVREDEELVRFGYSPERGFQAESIADEELIIRTRTGGVPTVESRRPAMGSRDTFSPDTVDPLVISKALQERRSVPDEPCAFEIEWDGKRDAPLMEIRCGQESSHVDLEGREVES